MNINPSKLAERVNELLHPGGLHLEIERLAAEAKVKLTIYRLVFFKEQPRAVNATIVLDESELAPDSPIFTP